ncbi:high mobility group box domain-containing protein, partial [Mycena leptocephala]
IPRPRNPFICFRSDYVKAHKRAIGDVFDQAYMSRGAGEIWRGMSEAERLPYIELAREEKQTHARQHPNYRY